ncbi:regulatory protein RecX [Arcanobacterium haemolyticum]|nr:regulatory protein RecX [Arcanobacterium haemolyticum]
MGASPWNNEFREAAYEGESYGEQGSGHEYKRSRTGKRSRRQIDVESLSLDEHRKRAHDIIMRQLAMMDRSRAQLRQALERRDVPDEVAEELLEKFEEAGLINDERFAQSLARSRFDGRGASRRAILMELQRKGIDRYVAAEAVEGISDDDEIHNAVQLASKKLRSASGNPATLYQRTYGMLARRGYSPSVCSRALSIAQENLTQEQQDEDRNEFEPWTRLGDDV